MTFTETQQTSADAGHKENSSRSGSGFVTPPKPGEKLLDRSTFSTEWITNAYLDDFYTKVDDPAMQMVLTFFPNIVARVGPIQRMLDFGAGPTIHVAAACRATAEEIYLADYLPQNREELQAWREGKSNFDWSTALKMILTREGNNWTLLSNMQEETRRKVSGIFHCDCFSDPAVDCPPELQGTFDMFVSIFCVEYCCNTYDEFKSSIQNMSKQIRKGGYIVLGGCLEETWCSFGGRKFTCLFVTREMLLEALAEAGLIVDKDHTCVFYEINGMYMVCAKKH